VAQRQLRTVLADLLRSLQESRRLASDAYQWSLPGARPHISRSRRDHLTEMAFLRAFLAWEVFVEESFVLYLLGQRAPRGRAPFRYAFPPNQRAAMDWVVPEGRAYAGWTVPAHVTNRAERFFRGGRPFAQVLRGNQSLLEETRIIRNAIAHRSMSAHDKFESFVRTKLGVLPPRTTVGSFLLTINPVITPPASFLESYIGKIDLAAKLIVPA
jgi:hypothetical protein